MYRPATFVISHACYGVADFIIQPSSLPTYGNGQFIDEMNYFLKYNLSSGVGAFSTLCGVLAISATLVDAFYKNTKQVDVYLHHNPNPETIKQFNRTVVGVTVLGTTSLIGKEFFDAAKPNQEFDTVDTGLVLLAGVLFWMVNKAQQPIRAPTPSA